MNATELKFCQVKEENGIFWIALNRPSKLNTMPPEAHRELSKVFDHYQNSSHLRVAIIYGNGRAFCAGFDLQSAAKSQAPDIGEFGFIGLTARPQLWKPVISAVHGVAFGGGFEIALASDIVVATSDARFALPEPKVGLAALAGGISRLSRQLGYQRAMSFILTGREMTCQQAFDFGLVAEIVKNTNTTNTNEETKRKELLECAAKWANLIMQCSPDSIRVSKQIALEAPDPQNSETRQKVLSEYLRLQQSPNMEEGAVAFIQKRKPLWKL